MAKGLTKRQQVFVDEYCVDLNAKRAAISAGYSEKSAESQASQLLKNPKVSEAVARKTEKRCKRLEITADKVLQELAKLAFFDPRKLYNDDGTVKQITELDDETAAVIAGLEVYEEFDGKGEDRKQIGWTKKFKLADKGANLERLGRYFKLFTDRAELSGSDGGPINLVVAFEKSSNA